MEVCPAALTEGPCEVVICLFFFIQAWRLPAGGGIHSPEDDTLGAVGRPGLKPGMLKKFALCCPSRKLSPQRKFPSCSSPWGQTGSWRYSGIKQHHRGWRSVWLPSLPQNLAGHVKGRKTGHTEQCGDEGGNTGKSLQDASEIGAFLGASAWHSMVISLGLPEALPPKCLKIAFCRLLESTVGSPKQLGCRHFGLEHKIR